MCVPVCMFVRTSTVLLPSRWCVVMSVTWIASNCGQVGIRSPHGCVRSMSFTRSIREVLDAPELVDHLLHDREVGDVLELQVLRDLPEPLLTCDRSLDVGFEQTFVLRPCLGLHKGVERLPDHVGRFLRLSYAEVDDLLSVGRVVHGAVRAHERADDALGRGGGVPPPLPWGRGPRGIGVRPGPPPRSAHPAGSWPALPP